MRTAIVVVLIAGLALCSGATLAQRSQSPHTPEPSQLSLPPPPQASQQSQVLQPSQLSQPTQSSRPSQQSQQLQPPQYSADGLYNLANSYARAGKPGLAVLNYERAALLAPDDADIRANLEYVRASAHVPTEPRYRFARIAQAVGPTLAAWLGVVGIALVGAALVAKRVTPRLGWIRAGGILVGVALIGLAVSNAMLLWPRMHEAVVLVNQTPARVSPVPMGDTAFVLAEADTVTITAKYGDFILVRTRGGLSGWVARANLGAVVP